MFYIKSLTGRIVGFVEYEEDAFELIQKAKDQYFQGTGATNVYTVHPVVPLKDCSDKTVNEMVNGICCPQYIEYRKVY